LLSLQIPQFRDLAYNVEVSLGPTQLSGVPTDVAFDNQRVLSGMSNFVTSFSVGPSPPINGKSPARPTTPPGSAVNTSEPTYLFVAVPNPLSGTGVVDVINLNGTFNRVDTDKFHAGVQSISAPNVQVLMDYFRQ
jgi:hypothetical protein